MSTVRIRRHAITLLPENERVIGRGLAPNERLVEQAL